MSMLCQCGNEETTQALNIHSLLMCVAAGQSYLAALTRTDSIVISRGFVLADEAGLVDSGRRRWRWRAGDQLLRTGALRFDGCRESKREEDEKDSAQMTK